MAIPYRGHSGACLTAFGPLNSPSRNGQAKAHQGSSNTEQIPCFPVQAEAVSCLDTLDQDLLLASRSLLADSSLAVNDC